MPTKRTRRATKVAVSPAALAPWREGDLGTVNRLWPGRRPWNWGVISIPVDPAKPPPPDADIVYRREWQAAVDWQQRLIEVAGPPGKEKR